MSSSAKAIRYAISGVLTIGLLAGCAASNHLARAGDYSARANRKLDKAVDGAEAAVAKSPRDAATRVALGQAYLEAGRFQSAATTFQDAITLGDADGRTQLSLALAQIGAGNGPAAVAVLDDARDAIPASDRGLALALAGETNRGIAILVDALRGGENSPKLRQNLAYAYALDGRWREARLMMAQDVPADQINDRIGAWATISQPQDVQKRVAHLLGSPAGVKDPGQPQQLALSDSSQPERLAAADAPGPAAPSAAAELPPIDQPSAVAVAEPAPPPAPLASEAPAATAFAAAFAAPQSGFVAQPVVQPTPARDFTSVQRYTAKTAAAPQSVQPVGGTHLVQLGSFSSEANARRAWRVLAARNPELRNYRMTITPAVVNGRNFWRVAAAGLNAGGALRVCAGVKNHGGACFAYAATRAPAGAKPELALAGAGPAKARRH
jgi:tetratricopeptide (TPR) repeat protein